MALLKFKRSATPSKVPTTSDLALGELALNTYDGKVYMKKDDGTQAIVEVGGTSGGGTVTSVAATAGTGISVSGSPITTSGTLTITNTAPDQTVTLTQAGTTTITGTYPNFTISSADQYDGTVTSVSGTGTVNGLTLSGTVTSSGSLTLGGTLSGIDLTSQITGTLPVANGGTGATSLTSGYVLKGNGTSPVSASVIYDDGTKVGVGTISPDSKVDIEAANSQLRLTDSDDSKFVEFSYSGGKLVTRNNSTSTTVNQFTLDESGRLGIGTISPSSSQLHVYTNTDNAYAAKFDQDHPTGWGVLIDTDATVNTDPALWVKNATDTIMWAGSGGDVGIGTSSPANTNGGLDASGALIARGGIAAHQTSAGAFDFSGNDLRIRSYGATAGTGSITFRTGGGGGSTDTARMSIDSSGSVIASVDMRAPIFYDSNNTGYYLDPAGSNVLHNITALNQIDSVGPLYTRNNIYNLNAGQTGWITVLDRNSGNHILYGGNSVRAPIFYDSNDTAYYVDAASTSLLKQLVIKENSAGNRFYGATSGNDQLFIKGLNYTHALNLLDSYNTSSYARISGGFTTQSLITLNGYSAQNTINKTSYYGSDYATVAGTITATADFRAPRFYDSNNTAFYLDPAATSVLNGADFDGIVRIATGSVGPANTTDGLVFDGNYTNGQYRHRFRKRDDSGGIPLYLDYAANTANSYTELMKFGPNTADGSYLTVYGIISSNTDIRAPRFYDSDNTAYYVDPNTNSRLYGYLSFGLPGSGANANGRWLSIEGNAGAADGEGSGRLFFSEHNSTTASMDNYGMSLAYRGGSTSIVGASGNTWTGLTQIGNGEWGMFGHNNSASGAVIMSGFRDGDYVKVHGAGGVWTNAIRRLNGTRAIDLDQSVYTQFLNPSGSIKLWLGNNNYNYYNNDSHIFRNTASGVTMSIDINGAVISPNSFRAPIFYDSANTNYYVDPASSGSAIVVNGYMLGGLGAETTGGTLDWNNVNNVRSGSTKTLLLGSATNGMGGGTYYHPLNFEYSSKDGSGNVTQMAIAYGTPGNRLWMRGRYDGSWSSWVEFLSTSAADQIKSGYLQSNSSLRAPIFYDSDDTAYYVNPASGSYVSGEFGVKQSGTNGFRIYSPTGTQSLWVRAGYDTDGTATPVSSPTNIQFQSSGSSGGSFTFVSGNTKALTVSGDYAQGAGSLRAPIFYDSNNTNFYVNPDGTTSANFNGDINFGGELNMVSTTAQNKYIDHHGDLRFRYSNNSSFFNERLRIAGASNFTQATGSLRAPLFYDSDDTGYYINPNATSNCSTVQAINFQATAAHGNGYRFWASDSYKIYMSSSGNGTWGGRVAGETTSDYNMYFRMTGGTNRGFVFSAGSAGTTKVAGIDASGNGRFIGDVVAYSSSDARLKENLEVIPNALDKVQALSGYTFDWNDKQDAYEVGKRDVGVIAQDVEAVLPEVVVDRELTGYKAVNYEKLVPLLIEAIKELKAEVETLKKG